MHQFILKIFNDLRQEFLQLRRNFQFSTIFGEIPALSQHFIIVVVEIGAIMSVIDSKKVAEQGNSCSATFLLGGNMIYENLRRRNVPMLFPSNPQTSDLLCGSRQQFFGALHGILQGHRLVHNAEHSVDALSK